MLISGCARDICSNQYTEASLDEAVTTFMAVVVDKREITIQESDKLKHNELGASVGGVGGFFSGNQDKGSFLVSALKTVAGSVVGAVTQKKLNTQTAFEYIIQVHTNGDLKTVIQKEGNIEIGQEVFFMEPAIGRPRIRIRGETKRLHRKSHDFSLSNRFS